MNGVFESCLQKFKNFVPPHGEIYCNWTWDSVLCWPPTKASTTAVQHCPKDRGIDPTKLVYKKCSATGRWESKTKDTYDSPQGWTNYTTCFTSETWELFKMLYADSDDNAKIKIAIAEKTRTLEIVGFSISLVALLFSLAIFFRFRLFAAGIISSSLVVCHQVKHQLLVIPEAAKSGETSGKGHTGSTKGGLRNNRTKIHKNLFIAMEIQVLIRLILYIDQMITNDKISFGKGIHNTPILCETFYVFLEYARTAMFMWMFVEGLYLHNIATVTVFHQGQSYSAIYSVIGWGSPIIITAAWALVMTIYFNASKCWWGYNLTMYFWIMEGPRLAVVVLNFLFLLNVIRVLVVKLRQSRKSEIEQVRKAVRAAILLVPLLGITNIISMSKSPLEKSVWEFALWSYATHFLTSFQGFFISFLYCFLNGEVKAAVMKSISTYFSLKQQQNQLKTNYSCRVFTNLAPLIQRTPDISPPDGESHFRLEIRSDENFQRIGKDQEVCQLVIPTTETRV